MTLNFDGILSIATAVIAAALAGFVFFSDRRSAVHRSFAVGMAAWSAGQLFAGFSLLCLLPADMILWQRLKLAALSLVPGSWLVFSLGYSRGNYREFFERWRLVVRLAFIVPVGLVALFWRDLVVSAARVEGTDAWILQLGRPGFVLHVLLILFSVIVLMNLEKTLRASRGTMRWQIKYMVLGLAVIFAVGMYVSTQALLYSALHLSLEVVSSGALLVGGVLIVRSLFRARVFKVDLYPSHEFLFKSITALLVGIYLLAIGFVAQAVTFFGGSAAFPLKAFLVLAALAGLSLVLLSERVRQRARRFVSTHLRRPQYDYRTLWSAFAGRTAPLTDSTEFCRAVAQMVSEIFEVLSVTLWLTDETAERLAFGGSTSLPESRAKDLVEPGPKTAELIAMLRDRAHPVDIDASGEPWVAELKRYNPDYFKQGGHRICMPLAAGGQLLGVMTLGDRVSGLPYTVEEFDLLKTLGDQAAAKLLNIRLADRLLVAREMEAFQTMSTFFIHDLKNTASTLSLMLQNLPRHFEDPAFREDALSAMSKSVGKINDVIRRLTLLKQQAEMKRVEADLNDVVEAGLAGLTGIRDQVVTKILKPVPRILMDPAQVQKVVVNLVLNAVEASRPGGEIRLETLSRDRWAVLSVSDQGVGMSREFIAKSLFRPFQSTKTEGMGIGLFQSKVIVEAHHGRIEVESEEGRGSTFRILLPVTAEGG